MCAVLKRENTLKFRVIHDMYSTDRVELEGALVVRYESLRQKLFKVPNQQPHTYFDDFILVFTNLV